MSWLSVIVQVVAFRCRRERTVDNNNKTPKQYKQALTNAFAISELAIKTPIQSNIGIMLVVIAYLILGEITKSLEFDGLL